MSGFFILIWLVVMMRFGTYNYQNLYLDILFIIIYIIGVAFNLLGRFYLGHNWGNNVVIYKDHSLVNKGVYKIVRHPLYASIIWMIYSVGILCQNYMVIVLNTIIFIPAMYYRAKQEEKEQERLLHRCRDSAGSAPCAPHYRLHSCIPSVYKTPFNLRNGAFKGSDQ